MGLAALDPGKDEGGDAPDRRIAPFVLGQGGPRDHMRSRIPLSVALGRIAAEALSASGL